MPDLADAVYGATGSEKTIDRERIGQTVVRQHAEVQGTNMDGETVLLDLRTGRYYTLNRLASVIWQECDGTRAVADIHATLCARFDVTAEQALEDLIAMLNQLCREDLIQVITQ
jgi:hypothetical protein